MSFSFLSNLENIPAARNKERAKIGWQRWHESHRALEDPQLAGFLQRIDPQGHAGRLIDSVFANSPFLTEALLHEMGTFRDFCTDGPDRTLARVMAPLGEDGRSGDLRDEASLKTWLRGIRRKTALLTGLAEITEAWSTERSFDRLSECADALISHALDCLLRQTAERGQIELSDEADPQSGCGYVLLAMGKLGARELNYSSDIDLIALFDPERARTLDSRGPQHGFVRLTRSLIGVLEERTRDGYVHRTDFRLRPDPGSMPLAISVNSASLYYESLGQNWERAAMIKARPVAGDLELGKEFLTEIRPFVWRKHLDFWAIQDIHSIKRQVYAHKGGSRIAVGGHNIKLGRGGIREIELFAQTQQLIWGGRTPQLRAPRTLDALKALARAGHVTDEAAAELSEAYLFLRRLEHRLQMVEDKQTHTLPDTAEGLEHIAAFLGFPDRPAFERALLERLHTVENHYADLFEEAPQLSGPGNLVFTGGEPEPGTLDTLARLGFADGARVFALVSGWHHGRYRATNSTRSRQLLTEIVPALLEELGKTVDPDRALGRIDEFLAGLPAGVQIFSLLSANPVLLELMARIMGNAPALARQLSRNPGLLEAVLSPDFFETLPSREELAQELDEQLSQARHYEEVLDLSRRWAGDRRFQAGVHLLLGHSDVAAAGRAFTDIAETALLALQAPVADYFAEQHGRLPGARLAILALGKLGAGELTISSDLDLIFVCEMKDPEAHSDGRKPLDARRYLTRLAQRTISALTALTAEGQLYEVDMRLRPSGHSGPLVTTLPAFTRYQETEAWTWEHMALTRARVVVGDQDFAGRIEEAVKSILSRPRDPDQLVADIESMRQRLVRQRPSASFWDLKYERGGLVDQEFLIQYLQLRHASEHPEVLAAGTTEAVGRLKESGLLPGSAAEVLMEANWLTRQLQALFRLTIGERLDESSAPDGLLGMLAQSAGFRDFEGLKRRLAEVRKEIYDSYAEFIERPASEAATIAQAERSQG